MIRRTARLTIATLLVPVALGLAGATGTTAAAATPQRPASVEQVLWTSPDGTAQITLGRNQRCPSGYVCLYENTYWNQRKSGRMLKFRDSTWQQLSRYGFNDKTSSWRNHTGRGACLSWNWPAKGSPKLPLAPGSSAAMGKWNEKASGVKAGRC
jgi:hypothetical protein